jgi:hypothetical protein
MISAFRVGSCVSVLLTAVACKSPPSPTETTPTGTASVATASAATASAATTGTDDCQKLRKVVVDEAAKLAECKTNDDCKLHRLSVCDFHELGCYVAHVNKAGDTALLDKAVSEYAKTCSLTKCKCEIPEKSVCKSSKCTDE